MKKNKIEETLLGDFPVTPKRFHKISEWIQEFQTSSFQKLNERQKRERVNLVLLDLIEKEATPCFLLPAMIDYITQVSELKILELYAFSHFELWLNQFSPLSVEENLRIRGKIVGKWIPREEYQCYFPIGMGKTYPGSHYVTAHSSPDLDTTVASFWGWVDAFGARIGENLHLWNLPGGPPTAQVEIKILFQQIFGEAVFQHLIKKRTSLFLSSLELMTQKGLVRKQTNISTLSIDHARTQNAVVLVDEQGYYLGDWRSFDVEGVRQIIMLLNNCLRWFENDLHLKLISLFGKEDLALKDVASFIESVFCMKIGECAPAKEFTEKQREHVQDYLCKVLHVKQGIESTFEEFAKAMKGLQIFDFQEFVDLVESLHQSPLFDRAGMLIENRPKIFAYLEKIIRGLDRAIQSVRSFVDRLDVALNIKTHVLGYLPQYISYRADVEEVRSKMGNYPYMTVIASDKEGKPIPLGIVHASDLHRPVLGTVTLRDFCNREETKIPPYFEVISVIDHHKSSLQTHSAPMCLISDAQSTNVLCAELAFALNDRFGTGGLHPKQIEAQMASLGKDLGPIAQKRLFQRLLQRNLVGGHVADFFIDPMREYIEYLHFLYGILDDTDLLTKVSQRDVVCVAALLNRLKSLMLQQEVEIVSFDDLPRDGTFVMKAAKRILQNPDMYSLYRKIYLTKEESVEENFLFCARGKVSSVFVDTKEQNGCTRIGQTKIFNSNYPTFASYCAKLREKWSQDAALLWKERPEFDLHLHMISTIAGAEALFKGAEGGFAHQDELWIWIPFSEQSIENLKSFLNAFKAAPQLVNNPMKLELYGNKAREYERIFEESFVPLPKEKFPETGAMSIAVLKYKAGSLNSRKAMISPYLPRQAG